MPRPLGGQGAAYASTDRIQASIWAAHIHILESGQVRGWAAQTFEEGYEMLRCLAGHVIFRPDRAENSGQRNCPDFCGVLGFGPPRQNARYGGQLHHRATVKGRKAFIYLFFFWKWHVTSAIQHQRGILIRRSLLMRKRKRNILSKSGLRDSLKKTDLCEISLIVSTIQILGNGLQRMALSWPCGEDRGNVDLSKCKSGWFRTARLLFHLFCFELDRERNMSSVCVHEWATLVFCFFVFYLILTSCAFALCTLRPLDIPCTATQYRTNLQWVKIENRRKNWISGTQRTASTAVQEQTLFSSSGCVSENMFTHS